MNLHIAQPSSGSGRASRLRAATPGLDTAAGVRLQLNDRPFTETTAFTASGPAGGVVKLDIGPEALQQMRQARRFNILTWRRAARRRLETPDLAKFTSPAGKSAIAQNCTSWLHVLTCWGRGTWTEEVFCSSGWS